MIVVGRIFLRDHPTAPHLQIGTINGHQVVVGRHYDEGTLGFFIPNGAIVPDKLAEEMWVHGKLSGKNKDRVKAREMHGVFSEGLFYGSRYQVGGAYRDSESWNPSWVEGQIIDVGISDG